MTPPRLHLLGAATLDAPDADATGFLAGPKRVALATYLALARPRGFQRRDVLLALLWPELSQKSGRNALSNLLHHLRRTIGSDTVVNRGLEEVGLDPAAVWVDAVAFESARDEPARALELYRGDLLEGFFVRGAAPEFEQWLDGERRRLRDIAAAAAWAVADVAEQAGDAAAARAAVGRAAELGALSDAAHLRVVEALARLSDRAGALAAHEAFVRRLGDELGVGPSAEAVAAAARLRQRRPSGPSTGSARRVAVLPFETLGASEPTAFTAGVHAGVIARLSVLPGLDVISRTSVRRYAHPTASVPEIAAALGAGWVLEGEVQETGAEVRVVARLVDGQTDRQAWTGDYRRPLDPGDVFRIQGEVTQEVARALQVEVGGTATPDAPTASLAAYRLWAVGRQTLSDRSEPAMRRAAELFRQAIAEDPAFALAHVGLADALGVLHDYGFDPDGAGLPEAERAIRTALALAPDLAEAHASLGGVVGLVGNTREVLRHLDRSIELRPSYAEAHNWRAWLLALVGRPAEALASARRAVELDPLSPEALSNLALGHVATGDPARMLVEARRLRDLGSSWGTGAFYEGVALYELGRAGEAAAVLRGVVEPWAGAGPQATRAVALAADGRADEARDLLDSFEADGTAFPTALAHLALGDPDAAAAALDRVGEWGYWPTLAVRYLYGDLWARLADARLRELRAAVDRSWSLPD